MKRWFSLILLGLIASVATAQVVVHGRILSAVDKTPIEMATVRLFIYKANDSVMVKGAQTNPDGEYYLDKVYPGDYKLYISSVGFREQCVLTTVKDQDVQIRDLLLAEDVQALSEVEVKGHAAEMTVKGDTIEFNTAAYKVEENAMVEDLLKKLNGVQVDKEGNVTVNGEGIKAVRIDGKKFFGNDVQTATKNIPADMIEKVQVIDEKSETAKLTGFEDDETERVINLKLKQNRKKGVFGNYSAAAGADMVTDNGGWFDYGNPAYGTTAAQRTKHFFENDFRYEAGVFTNILSGESQTTIIGAANNTNQIRMGRGRSGFGSQNQGITWSENIGINTNVDLSKKIIQLDSRSSLAFGGDVAFSHARNDSKTIQNQDRFSSDATYHNNDTTSRRSHAWDVNLRLELEYQIDTLNKLLLQPTLSYTNNNATGGNTYRYHRDSILVKDGYQDQLTNAREIGGGMKAIYNRKFLRPGRTLTLTGDFNYADTKSYNKTYSWDNILNHSQVDQYANTGSGKLSYSLRASYVEPIYKNNHLLEFALSFSGNTRKSDKVQMSMDTLRNEYAYDSAYSNNLQTRFYSEAAELNYRWISEKCDLTVGVKFNPSQTRTISYYGNMLDRDTLISVFNWSPNASFKYKMGKKQFARIIYRGNTIQPSINQMMPVRNNSDAMSETLGNQGLKPAFQHTLRFMFSKFNIKRFSSIMTGIRGNLTKDALANNTLYDETGKVYMQTVNAGSLPFDVGADLMYNTPLAKKMMQFHTRTAISYNQRVAYTSSELTAKQIADIIARNDIILGTLSKTGNLLVQENLSLRFTHDIVDVGVTGDFNYSRTQNSVQKNSLSNVFNWTLTGDIEFHLPKSWTIGADCGYTARYGYKLDDVDELILNAHINKSWKNATLALKVMDILNDKKNIVQTVSDNSVKYQKFNSLPTYFTLTFTYKFNKMGGLQAKGMAGFIQEAIESGVDPSKGPMKGKMPPTPPKQ